MDNLTPGIENLGRVVPFFRGSFATVEKLPVTPRSFEGPISSEMWAKLQKMKSEYPDTFDWSIYDKIHARFGSDQPKGGVVFGQTFRLANWSDSCSKCHYAFEIDTYGRGCVHNCAYCYAKDSLTKRGYWNRPHPFPVDLAEVRKIFYTVFETTKASKWREILEKRVPLRIGSMSDSFMWLDRKYGVSLELLKILRYYQYPYIIFTRSDLVSQDEYLNALDPKLGVVQFSISGQDEQLTRLIEPGAPSVKRRFAALHTLAQAGIWTAVRVNPLFPKYPDGYYTDQAAISANFPGGTPIPTFPLFDIDRVDEFVDLMREARVPTLLVGMVRLTSYTINQLSKATGTDFRLFFKPEAFATRGGGNTDKNFSDSEIAFYYKKIQHAASKGGIRFTTCYIGNGVKDYLQYQHLWSNKSDCCDVKGTIKSFAATAQDIDWDTRRKHAPKSFFADRAQREEEFYANNANALTPANKEVIPRGIFRAMLKDSAQKTTGVSHDATRT